MTDYTDNLEAQIKTLKEHLRVAQQRLAEQRTLTFRLISTMRRKLGDKWMKKHIARFCPDWSKQ